MLKSNEYKAYGSIRKTKFGACGVILALAILGVAFGSNTVSADEVKPTTPVAVEKKTEVEVPVAHDNLDKAVAEAKDAGVKVEVGATQDKGVATTETVAEKKKEIEADYAKQGKNVKTVTKDYSSKVDKTTKEREVIEQENKAKQEAYDKAVEEHKAEVKRIEAENKAILADNAQKEADTKAENERIAKDNAEKEATYNKNVADQKAYNEKVEKENADLKANYDKKQAKYESDLAKYNKEKEELAKKGVKAEKPHITVYGDYDESQRGSVNYYKK